MFRSRRPPVVATSLLVSLFASASAGADEANRNFMPFGERAAFLGNAGITSDLGEAVFYNPANLARITYPNLSVSGNLYARFEIEAKPLYLIEGEGQNFEASGFISSPSTLISTYRIGAWSLATAVLIPEILKFKNRVTFESATLRTTLLQVTESESLWIGGGLAREVTPDISAGLSVFVTNDSRSDLFFTQVVSAGAVAESTSSSDLAVLNLTAIAGLSWRAHPTLLLGARANLPPIKLSGSGDLYAATLTATDEMDLLDEQEFEDLEVSKPYPWDLGLGLSFRPNPDLELILDVNLQLPDTLIQIDDSRIGRAEVEVDLAPRVGAGAEWQFRRRMWMRLGALYNGSAHQVPEEAEDPPSDDYYGVTGGLAWQKDRTQTALGGFFMYSASKVLVGGSDPLELSDARTLFYGALLTVSYRL